MRGDRQARKLSKTKSSSVVLEAPFGLEKEVHRGVYTLIQVQGCSFSRCWRPAENTVSYDTVLTCCSCSPLSLEQSCTPATGNGDLWGHMGYKPVGIVAGLPAIKHGTQ